MWRHHQSSTGDVAGAGIHCTAAYRLVKVPCMLTEPDCKEQGKKDLWKAAVTEPALLNCDTPQDSLFQSY